MKLSRRKFLIGTGWVAGGLTVVGVAGYSLLPPLPTFAVTAEEDIDTWVQMLPTGVVRFYVPRAEMGQGIGTGLSQVVAEELGVSLDRIDCQYQSTAAMAPCQMTVGSQSIENYFELTARAAASLRETLRERAANYFAASGNALADATVTPVENGFAHGDDQFVSYEQLLQADEESIVPLLSSPNIELRSMRPASEWSVLGKSVKPLRIDDIVRGRETYSRDVRLPEMQYGAVARPPQLGAEVQRYNRDAAMTVAGVNAVVEHEGQVGVVAETPMAAASGVAALAVEWQTLSHEALERVQTTLDVDAFISADNFNHSGDEQGTLSDGVEAAKQTLSLRYDSPMVAHCAMEPRAGVAHFRLDDSGAEACDLWTGSQDPWLIQSAAADALGLGKEKVTVHNHRVGGAFGGRVLCQASIEAAWLSQAVKQPVKVQWTREDEFAYNYVGPQFSTRIDAGLDANGRISHWHGRAVGEPVLTSSMFFPQQLHWLANMVPDSGTSRGMELPYSITPLKTDFAIERLPMPTGPWRGLGAAPNTFAVESAMDELAQAAGVDPIEFRLQHLDNARLSACLTQLKQNVAATDRPVGVAAAVYKGVTYVAVAAQVEVESNKVRVTKLSCVHDCGRVISPDQVRAQIEGNLVWGIGMALTEQFDLQNGIAQTNNFDRYQLPRQSDVPDFDITLINSDAPSSGAAEAALAPVAAAIANAVFAITGKRYRQLPISPAASV